MTQLSEQIRLAHQLISVKANELGAIAAVLAVTSSRISEPLALGFGLTSGGLWLVGARFQRLALDPPREDRHLIETYYPLDVVTTDMGVIGAFGVDLIQLAWAADRLVRSVERLAVDDPTSVGQLGAVATNAAAASSVLGRLSEQTNAVNDEYRGALPSLRAVAAARLPHRAPAIVDRLEGRLGSLPFEDGHSAALQVTSRLRADELPPPDVIPDEFLDTSWIIAVQATGRVLQRAARRPTSWLSPGLRRALERSDAPVERVAASLGPRAEAADVRDLLAQVSQLLGEVARLVDDVRRRIG